jgi:REP element-mobilizing transposase RayT
MSPGRRKYNTGRECEPPLPEPLAYFLTWPTYGTWLPGDERGWVRHERGARPPDQIVEREAAARVTDDACRLDHAQRRVVETTIAAHCEIRRWTLYALNCRSDHVHVIVAANRGPDEIREQLKSWCTRWLKEAAAQQTVETPAQQTTSAGSSATTKTNAIRKNWWAERGSGIFINDEAALEAIIHYVKELQDLRGDQVE